MRFMSDTPSITRDDVANLARLARIDLAPDTLDHYAEQLAQILGAVAQVSEVAADDIPPMSHPLPLVNVFREDVVRPGLSNAEALSGAPSVESDRFRVPRILDEE